jgi:hypothetical protein
VVKFREVQLNSLQHSHFSPQHAELAAVETNVVVAASAFGLAVSVAACWQHASLQLHAAWQSHSVVEGAAEFVAVSWSIANTLVAKAVKIKTANVDFMSSSP